MYPTYKRTTYSESAFSSTDAELLALRLQRNLTCYVDYYQIFWEEHYQLSFVGDFLRIFEFSKGS